MEYQSIGGQAPASLCLRAFSSAVYRPPSDRSLFEYPPDILAYTRALPGSRPKKIQKTKQDGQKTVSFCLVEHRGLDRPHRFACVLPPWLPVRSPADRSLLEYPPDILAYAHALSGSRPRYIMQKMKRDGIKAVSLHLVEHRGLEPLTS